jgi:hypothetical protein
VVLGLLAGPSWGQDASAPSAPQPLCAQPEPASNPLAPPCTADGPVECRRWLQRLRYDDTGLPGGGRRGFAVNDVELAATVGVPWQPALSPLLLTPSFALHSWGGPRSAGFPGHPDLPADVYDAYLEAGWRERWAPWLFTDVAVAPGLSADFHEVRSSSFRVHGRGLAIVAFSPQWQAVGGVLYTGRNNAKVLPAGGVIWNPNEDTRCEFLFPQPKVSRRLVTLGDVPLWGYLAGEFGGGAWTVERADGRPDSVDYRDVRVLLGLEWVTQRGLKAHVEAGYVFDRVLDFTSATPDFKPDSTLMLRAGISY